MYQWEERFDEVALSKGKKIKRDGKVKNLTQSDAEISAEICGVKWYEIHVTLQDGEPTRMKCQCPKAKGGSKCEHMAAVLYAVYGIEEDLKEEEERESRYQKIRERAIEEACIREENEKMQKEAEEKKRKLQEEEQRKQAEVEERKAAEALRKAKKEQKVQEAIERVKRAKLGDEETENMNVSDKENSLEQHEDDYCYYDMDIIRSELELSKENIKKGRQLGNSGKIRIDKLSTGFVNDDPEPVVEVHATGISGRSEFPMYLLFSRERVFSRRCECPECRNKPYWYYGEGKCAYMAGLTDEIETALHVNQIGDATDQIANSLLYAFQGKHENEVMAEQQKLDKSLNLIPRLCGTDESLDVSFKIGEQKMFVVKNLFELCEHVEKSETATYGSKTEINHHISNFTDNGRKWYDFVHMLVQEEKQLEQRIENDGGYYEPGSKKGRFSLYGKNLDEFYRILGCEKVEYEDGGKIKNKRLLAEEEKNPKVTMTIRAADIDKKVFHGVAVSAKVPVLYQGVDASYFVEKDKLCRAENEYTKRIHLLTRYASGGELEFTVGRNHLSEFYYSVLPEFQDIVDIVEENPEEIQKHLPPEVQFLFYLDAEKNNITCRVHAKYGETEHSVFDIMDDDRIQNVGRYRMINKEAETIYLTQQIFPNVDVEKDCFHCGADEALMYEVLEHGVDSLMELGEVRYTQKFRNLFSVRKMKMTLGVSVSNGLLDLDIVTEDLTEAELLNILKSYQTRKKYYRMKNGDFMSLEDDSFEMLEEMMNALHLSPKELAKGHVQCPAYRTLYLDKLLEAHSDIYNTRDSHFRTIIKNFKTVNDADYDVPKSLDGVMRGYQKNGYRWLRTLEACHFGGILADDMGLGKTLQAISVLMAAKEEGKKGTSLIVCPASLVFNWGEEFSRFAPELKVMLVVGSQNERKNLLESYKQYDVVVTSYDLLKRDIVNYEEKHFLYQIIDEAQYIKNHTTAVAKAVKVINSEYRFAMTGTPIENRLSELWSIFDYLMPGFFYTYDVFRKEMELPIVKQNDEMAMERLQKMAGTFILRRLKENVLKDLPEKLEETRCVKMDKAQQRLYDAQVLHMRQQLAGQGDEEFNKNKIQILAELTKLRQICCDPSLCFENYSDESAKLESCMELIQSAIDGGHKILLFSQFTSMLDILENRLNTLGISHYVITGSTPKDKRLQMVKAFNQDQTPIFLISLKAGGVGLNLTGADVVIHYDPWWNLAVQNQATDRAHRIGQKKKVVVYKMIMKNSIEEKIQKLQESKRNLADQIVNTQTGQVAGMSREDLIELLQV